MRGDEWEVDPPVAIERPPGCEAPGRDEVAWARLTIPPMPVTTMKDSRMIEVASPWAMTVWA